MSAPPGWHLQDDGRERFWDGQQWTEQFRTPAGSDPTAPPPAPSWATSDGTATTSAEDEATAPPSDRTQAMGVDQTQQLPTVPPAGPSYGAPAAGPATAQATNPYATYGGPTPQQGYPAPPAQAGVPRTGYGSPNDPGPGWQPPQKSGGGLLKGCLIAAVVGVIVLVGVVIAAIFFFNRAVDEVRDTLPTFPTDLPSDFPSDLPTDGIGQKVEITVGDGFDLPRAQVEDGWSLEERGAAGFNAVEVKGMRAVLGAGGVPLFFTLAFPAADGSTVETPCTASGEAGQTVDVSCVPLLGDVGDAQEGTATSAF